MLMGLLNTHYLLYNIGILNSNTAYKHIDVKFSCRPTYDTKSEMIEKILNIVISES